MKGDPFHASKDLIRREPRFDDERLDRRLQETGFLVHAQTIKSYLEPFADAEVGRDAIAEEPAAIMSPCRTDADGERREEAGDEICRELRARRCFDRVPIEGTRPCAAGVRENGMVYSQFMNGLLKAGIEIDRKVLSDLAIHEPDSFKTLVEQSKAALAKKAT